VADAAIGLSLDSCGVNYVFGKYVPIILLAPQPLYAVLAASEG
jgi:hypothetical protein